METLFPACDADSPLKFLCYGKKVLERSVLNRLPVRGRINFGQICVDIHRRGGNNGVNP